MRIMLKSKIHRARVTDANIDYEGSITIDKKLMRKADILPYEQVHVLNITNGDRFTTYAIEGKKDEICINGAAARLAAKDDIVIILTYSPVEDEKAHSFTPKLVYLDTKNTTAKSKRDVPTPIWGDSLPEGDSSPGGRVIGLDDSGDTWN
ncbi:MAG: aspartate 1-decarboxylase [Dehalococcoidales bacterium]|nr:aspartate 1-decarboxylase [Dehalococcoidales bacterium]MDP6221600.1 aspartate 1-decarboxylase [Dehalococcoidales bacterium]MDP7109900.1 aspartate 1-decarboxylase [Dehalococcoidales bacterium]MDP7309818.1 aspartate 1-decarboxylase [Dehalococcoidales bacterium]MDP7409776.1 aspartate 1-decarboxylase [Dehalococcoidales bacterium]